MRYSVAIMAARHIPGVLANAFYVQESTVRITAHATYSAARYGHWAGAPGVLALSSAEPPPVIT